jgi:hypothetical protein
MNIVIKDIKDPIYIRKRINFYKFVNKIKNKS